MYYILNGILIILLVLLIIWHFEILKDCILAILAGIILILFGLMYEISNVNKVNAIYGGARLKYNINLLKRDVSKHKKNDNINYDDELLNMIHKQKMPILSHLPDNPP